MSPERSERRWRRRDLLVSLGAIGTSALAGCNTDDADAATRPGQATATTAQSTTPARTATTASPAEGPTDEATDAIEDTSDGAEASSQETDTRTTTTTPVDTWAEGGPPDRSNWHVTFQDDFSEGLDWDTWEVGFGPSVDHSCAASACARRENASVEDGRLVLETMPEGADDIPNSTWLADYTTGAVTPGASAAQTFGYFEVKAKLPAQPGGLPAFWAWSPDGNPPEIDFYEVFGEMPSTLTGTVHVDCNDNGELLGEGGEMALDGRVDEQFHVVGCAWTPESVTWCVDGVERQRVDDWYPQCHTPEPMFPILNTHVGGREGDFIGPDLVGDPTEADYPYTHEIEWIRVWQREDLPLTTPTEG